MVVHTPSVIARSGADHREAQASFAGPPLFPLMDLVLLADVDVPQMGHIQVIGHHPSYRGKVLAVGPDVAELQVGDVVRYRPFTGTRVDIDGDSYMLVKEDTCLCRIA